MNGESTSSGIGGVTAFAQRLDEARIPYDIKVVRADGVMFLVAVPGERWEIELMTDGTVEVEVFKGGGRIEGESKVSELFALQAD